MQFRLGRGKGKRGGQRKFKKLGMNRPENCICPSCSTIIPHQPGMPCYQTQCPKCGALMMRQLMDLPPDQ